MTRSGKERRKRTESRESRWWMVQRGGYGVDMGGKLHTRGGCQLIGRCLNGGATFSYESSRKRISNAHSQRRIGSRRESIILLWREAVWGQVPNDHNRDFIHQRPKKPARSR